MPSQGPKLPASCYIDGANGDWMGTLENTLSDTDSGAYANLNIGGSLIGITDILVLNDFNFSIPTSASVNNISVQLRARSRFAAELTVGAMIYLGGPYSNTFSTLVATSSYATFTISNTPANWSFSVPSTYYNLNGTSGFGVGIFGYNDSSGEYGSGLLYLDWVKIQLDYTGGSQTRGTSLGFPAIY